MKTVVLGDTHGRSIWKLIVNKINPDRVIFIGDYFDSKDGFTAAEQIHNFKEIMNYKKNSGKEVITLIGNHDYHYMRVYDHGQYSSFQQIHWVDIQEVIYENIEHLQMVHLQDDILFSHAGVTKTFLDMFELTEDEIEKLNEYFKYNPDAFGFNGIDSSGDDITQSCIWVRPRSLFEDGIRKYKQVVGHTMVEKIIHPTGDSNFYFIDTLGTSQEFLIIENNKITISKL